MSTSTCQPPVIPGVSNVFPPAPTFTEAHLPDLNGRVYIVTGATSGVGMALTSILYGKNATVYLAARSPAKIQDAIKELRNASPSSTGRLEQVVVDFNDLTTVKPAAASFLEKETRLDVLFNNAGVMNATGTTVQGHEVHMGINCLGPHLFTSLLEPILVRTAALPSVPRGSVRIVNTSSMIQHSTPKGGIQWDEANNRPAILKSSMETYMISKVGNVFLARDAAQRLGPHGIIGVSLHPGLMKTGLQKNNSKIVPFVMGLVFKDAKYGAYTELFAGLSPEVTRNSVDKFIMPWGRFTEVPSDIQIGMRATEDGGNGLLQTFVDYCNRETQVFR